MSCAICINEGNIKTTYNDCIIESLEKIKFHYMSLKDKLCQNEQLTKSLKEENEKLKKTVSALEEVEKNETKKRRTGSCEEHNDSEISFSQNVAAKSIEQKSDEDLNIALNFDEEFELSFIPSTQVEDERKNKISKIRELREPLKTLPVKSIQLENKPLIIKQEIKSNHEDQENNCDKSINLTKSGSWISKESELKKSVMGSVQKRQNRNLRPIKSEVKTSNLSLKSGKLRQTRLQLDKSKNISTNFSDTTFCDEAIGASPNADSSLKRFNTSKQWQLRNISSRLIKSEDDSFLNLSNSTPKKTTSPGPLHNKSLDTSSVVMFTPASQDIIFLDETPNSFDIESMDLLKDLMHPTENLSNLKRLESDRIKMLQKNHGGSAAYISSKGSALNEEQNTKPNIKTEQNFTKPKTESSKTSPIESNNVKKTRIFDVDCDECQRYIKYLGGRLSDEEIEKHIRNCTNHKKRIDNNLTPDGFWDPIIKPFASDDPRNLTIVDEPFEERRK